MKPASWDYVKIMSDNLDRAAAMKESALKDKLIKALTREIKETIDRIKGAA